MGADAQTADDDADSVLQPHDARIIQMIPVIVGNEQTVDVRHIPDAVRCGSLKGPGAETYRSRIGAEDRIDENAQSANMDEEGGMSQPYHAVFIPVQAAKIYAQKGNGVRRRRLLFFRHERAQESNDETLIIVQNGAGNQIAKLSADVVR